ncbi:Nitroreductase [Robiginitalea myxolifaciens]|uniref:Putative NAD(P)H nitroreductase n=1 Tax=Robiginitalea myxolifaciens TaxID=400055 RepID=A0A1I6FUZ1_9FLAO|nr:nitroreductase [Robiginitalea myxolifaciens]SFR33728.1 Nitroreductase [Robiginitalea myxolifaciens]
MVEELIRKRRSIFPAQYSSQQIPDDLVRRIVEAARWAPTHRKTEPWRLKVLTADTRVELGKFLSEKYLATEENPKKFKAQKLLNNPAKAGAMIVICMQRDPENRVPEWEEIAATAMAVQNMWLVATNLGIGAYWSSPGLIKYMGEFLELAEGERCLGFFYMGYPEIPAEAVDRKPLEEVVAWL